MKKDGILEYIAIAVFIALAVVAGGGLDASQDASVKKAVLLADDEPVAQAHVGEQLTLKLDDQNSGVDATGYSKYGEQNVMFTPSGGEFTFPEGDFTKGKITGIVDMTFILHATDTLVEHIQEESFFHTDEHPESTFESTAIKKTDDGYQIEGYLTIKGIKKKIGLPSQIEETDETITVISETGIGISWWELKYGSIKEDVTLNIKLIFNKA